MSKKRPVMRFKGFLRISHKSRSFDIPTEIVAFNGVKFNPQTRIATVEFIADSVSLKEYDDE